MEQSLFLAKVIGSFMVVIAILALTKKQNLIAVLDNFMQNKWLITMSGLPALILGLLIVNSNNIWAKDWRVLITLVGYGAIIKGLIRLFSPETVVSMIGKWKQGSRLTVVAVIILILGAYLAYHGFSIVY